MLDRNICIILLTVLLSNTIYGLAAPFLPQLLDDKGVPSSYTGVIFAVYSISMIVVSLVAGVIVDKCGHARLMAFGSILMSVSIAAFSTAIYLDSNWSIICLAIVLRIGQGKFSRGAFIENCCLHLLRTHVIINYVLYYLLFFLYRSCCCLHKHRCIFLCGLGLSRRGGESHLAHGVLFGFGLRTRPSPRVSDVRILWICLDFPHFWHHSFSHKHPFVLLLEAS